MVLSNGTVRKCPLHWNKAHREEKEDSERKDKRKKNGVVVHVVSVILVWLGNLLHCVGLAFVPLLLHPF